VQQRLRTQRLQVAECNGQRLGLYNLDLGTNRKPLFRTLPGYAARRRIDGSHNRAGLGFSLRLCARRRRALGRGAEPLDLRAQRPRLAVGLLERAEVCGVLGLGVHLHRVGIGREFRLQDQQKVQESQSDATRAGYVSTIFGV